MKNKKQTTFFGYFAMVWLLSTYSDSNGKPLKVLFVKNITAANRTGVMQLFKFTQNWMGITETLPGNIFDTAYIWNCAEFLLRPERVSQKVTLTVHWSIIA